MLSIFFKKVQTIDITRGKSQTWIGLKLQQLLNLVFIDIRVTFPKSFENQGYCLKQGIPGYILTQAIQIND
ncbi:hypothetical protein PSCICN_06870 [Pseudomonas cichorii]|nr:hypothetical protein PSCICN_06870 [Pseudomonas cichorii]